MGIANVQMFMDPTFLIALGAFGWWLLQKSISERLKQDTVELSKRLDQETHTIKENLKATLSRVARLEADLATSRHAAYTGLWQITEALNLFGKEQPIDVGRMSEELKRWYFTKGWILSDVVRDWYFLIQEVLSYGTWRSLTFTRPPEHIFMKRKKKIVDVINDLRFKDLRIPRHTDKETSTTNLEHYIGEWRTNLLSTNGQHAATTIDDSVKNWILLQYLLSQLRTQVKRELRSSDELSHTKEGMMTQVLSDKQEPEARWYSKKKRFFAFGNLTYHYVASFIYSLVALTPILLFVYFGDIPEWLTPHRAFLFLWALFVSMGYPVWSWLETRKFECWVGCFDTDTRKRERDYYVLMRDHARSFWAALLAVYAIAGVWGVVLK